MEKPRIIIADTDYSYMLPLQLKFAEEFFEKIDLEIISDKTCFDDLFSVSQRAEILIVSEDLYDPAIQRHNIGKVFLMTEQYREEQTDELKVNRIFKYTSIKEIFNEIIGKSTEVLNMKTDVQKKTQIILVYSACRGTGKTTVALGISACLTQNYKKVLYINAGRLQSFPCMMENSSAFVAADVYAKLPGAGNTIYADIRHVIRKELFSYLPPFKAALMSLGLSYSIYEKIAASAERSGEYDFIVVDADPVFDEDKARLLNLADKVIIVTDQTRASVFATNILVSNINGISTEKYIFVCNNFDKDKDNALISPDVAMRFSVNDYIEHFNHYDQMKCEDLAKDSGVQKTAFLIIWEGCSNEQRYCNRYIQNT